MEDAFCIIGRERLDGTVRCILCRREGRPGEAGRRLVLHWRSPAAVEALLELGDIESLGVGLDGSTDEAPTLAAIRDRGEDPMDCASTGLTSAEEFWDAHSTAVHGGCQLSFAYLLAASGRWEVQHPTLMRERVVEALVRMDRDEGRD